MTTAYATRDVRDPWQDIQTDLRLGRSVRATGTTVTDLDTQPRKTKPDLAMGLWPGLDLLNSAYTSVSELVERITALILENAASVVALRLGPLRDATTYGVRVDVNYPATALDHSVSLGADQTVRAPAPHARLARELREMTGLSARSIGAALGVTREHFQRWIAGGPISDARHGLLIHLHTIALDVLRRLGPDQAALWWKTPARSGLTPEELLKQRRTDQVYRLAASIPDPAPIVDGVVHGLLRQDDVELRDDDVQDGGAAWSPYGAPRA